MKLSTKRLRLRLVRLADLEAFHELASSERVAVPAGFPTSESPAMSRKRLKGMIAESKTRPMLAVLLKDGSFLGTVGLRWPHRGVGEIGYSLLPRHWGRGYATEAVSKVVDAAFRRFGAHRVQATCWVRNPASAKVLAKAGLRREGVLRGYFRRGDVVRDELMWGITRPDWRVR